MKLYILHDLHRIFHHFHTQHNIHIGLFQDLGIVDKVIIQFDEPVTEPELFRMELVWDNDLVEINDLRHTWDREIWKVEVNTSTGYGMWGDLL